MPFLRNYNYDVFVSYSLTNDELTLDDKPWVRRFVELLTIRLKNLLPDGGKDVAFYFAAKGDLKVGQALASCRDEAKRSAIFLMIGSPRYLDSWPTSELRAFLEAGGAGRVFLAEMLPPGRTYPERIEESLYKKFWRATPGGGLQEFTETRGEFDVALSEFAKDLRDALVALSEKTTSKSVSRPADPRARTVLLARVTDDLLPYTERLATHLEQFDIPVVSADEFDDGADFRDAFLEALDTAPLIVQPLGPFPARKIRGLDERYDAFQAREARERTDRRLIQWRDPLLNLDEVTDETHRTLLSGEVEAMGFEAFKDMVVRAALAPPPPRPPPRQDSAPGGSLLFINADRADEETARRVFLACQARQITAMMPEYDLDTPKDWRANYAGSDRIAVIHEKSDKAWLNAQLKQFVKSEAKRKTPQDCVIYLGPPAPKPAPYLTITHPKFVVIEALDGDLDALIERLS